MQSLEQPKDVLTIGGSNPIASSITRPKIEKFANDALTVRGRCLRCGGPRVVNLCDGQAA